MARLIVTRTLVGLAALLIFLFVSFVLIELLIPGDQLTPLRVGMRQSELDALREQLGFFDPLPVRFWNWLTAFASGDLLTTEGQFASPRRIASDLGGPISRTVFVFATGLTLAFLLGTWLGRLTAKRGALSGSVTVGGIALYAMFPPFLAFVLAYFLRGPIFRFRSGLLGERHALWVNAQVSETHVFVSMTLALLIAAVAAALLGAAVRRRWHGRVPVMATVLVIGLGWFGLLLVQGLHIFGLDLALRAALPLLAFVLLSFGEFMLIMKTGMTETRHEDYVLTARAKGLSPRRVRDVHVARGALLVLVTRLAVGIPYLLAGLVIIERALGWEGIGSVLFQSIEDQDLFVVMTLLAFIGLLVLAVRLGTEVLEAMLDPRLRRPQKVRAPT